MFNFLRKGLGSMRKRHLFIVMAFVVGIVGVGVVEAQDVSKLTRGIRDLNGTLFKLLVNITTIVLFLTGIWQLVEGYMQHQLSSKWMSLLGIGVFIVALRAAPALFALLTGTDKTRFIREPDSGTTIFEQWDKDTGVLTD